MSNYITSYFYPRLGPREGVPDFEFENRVLSFCCFERMIKFIAQQHINKMVRLY